MDNRDRILDAAKKIYAQYGFRGATTRLIAIEADVNEVTLFRTFGSKAALFEALMQTHVATSPIPELRWHGAHRVRAPPAVHGTRRPRWRHLNCRRHAHEHHVR